MARRSYECIQVILEYIMETEDIYATMDAEEITALIRSSPSNLLNFFDRALKV